MTVFTYIVITFLCVAIGYVLYRDIRYIYYTNYAKNIIKTNSYTFYKAFSLIKDRKKRDAIYIVYAFCRYADDVIDEYKDVKALNSLKEDLTKFKDGIVSNSKIFKSLSLISSTYYDKNYDYKPYFDMIKGQEMDLSIHSYDTIEDLLNYCYHVASSVGMMLIPILAKDDEVLQTFALHLGYAMQITNILRDIGEDYKKGRIYIPKEVLNMYQVNIAKEMKEGPSKHFIDMFLYMENIARNYYDQALKNIHLFPEDVRKPLYYAAILYRAILDKCIEVGYDVISQKPFLNDEEKMQVIRSAGKV
jgi:4,4'-diapophytoene synthase